MTMDLLTLEGVRLGLDSVDRYDAVRLAGSILRDLGAVKPEYIDAMVEREQTLSSFVGEGFAIPHGTDAARALVERPALVFLQFPSGVDWAGQDVRAAIGIAAKEDEHVQVMSRLAQVLLDADQAARLRSTQDPEVVIAILSPDED